MRHILSEEALCGHNAIDLDNAIKIIEGYGLRLTHQVVDPEVLRKLAQLGEVCLSVSRRLPKAETSRAKPEEREYQKLRRTSESMMQLKNQVGFCADQMANILMAAGQEFHIHHQPFPNGNYGMSHHSQDMLFRQYYSGVSQLQRIFAALQTEVIHHPGNSPTSFACVENRIAKCICGCLQDVPERSRHIGRIQSLVAEYKVVQPVMGLHQKPTVSLLSVFVLLQDNYPNSCLRKLFDVFIAECGNVTTKTVTF